jgi:hypothetical protein
MTGLLWIVDSYAEIATLLKLFEDVVDLRIMHHHGFGVERCG